VVLYDWLTNEYRRQGRFSLEMARHFMDKLETVIFEFFVIRRLDQTIMKLIYFKVG
jgi:hypothetical protein